MPPRAFWNKPTEEGRQKVQTTCKVHKGKRILRNPFEIESPDYEGTSFGNHKARTHTWGISAMDQFHDE
jgi:hypothetical protein